MLTCRLPWVVVGLGFCLLAAGLARATPIVYTESATVSGSLGGTPFTNVLITITLTGDTANITGTAPSFRNAGTAIFSVSGIGSGTFTDSMVAFDVQNQGPGMAGITDLTKGDVFMGTFSSAFATYALSTSIGPLTGGVAENQGVSFPTTDGALILNSSTSSTFTAAASPEPISGSLLVLGVAGILAYGRLRKAIDVRTAFFLLFIRN